MIQNSEAYTYLHKEAEQHCFGAEVHFTAGRQSRSNQMLSGPSGPSTSLPMAYEAPMSVQHPDRGISLHALAPGVLPHQGTPR